MVDPQLRLIVTACLAYRRLLTQLEGEDMTDPIEDSKAEDTHELHKVGQCASCP